MRMNSFHKILLLTVLILCSASLQWATLTRGHEWGDDFSSYIMQAKSVVEGTCESFVETNSFTIEESDRLIGPVAYPWGTPVLLAPLYKLFGINMLALKSLNVVCYVLFLASLALFLRKRYPFPFLVLFVFLFAFNPTLLASLDGILSDIPFLLLSTVSVFLIGRIAVEKRPLFGSAADRVVLGALMAAAFFMRANGILLVLTLFGVHVVGITRVIGVRRGADRGEATEDSAPGAGRYDAGKIATNAIPYVAFFVLVLIWNAGFPRAQSFDRSHFGTVSAGTILRNVFYYGVTLGDFFAGVRFRYAWYSLSLPFLLVGVIESVRRDYHMVLYAVLTVLLYCALPFIAGVRYVFPLFPFYVYFVFAGARRVHGAIGERRRREAWTAAVIVLALAAGLFAKDSASRALFNLRNHRAVASGPYVETSREMFDFLRSGTEEDAVIVFFKPRLLRMVTGRQSLMITNPSNLARGDYLVFRVEQESDVQISLSDAERLVSEGLLVQVYANPDFRVYRIDLTP